MRLIYDFLIQGYRMLILIASVWNPKARAWISGRRGMFGRLEEKLKPVHADRIWMHCASVGEFEQGRPVLEAIRAQWPNTYIVLTFFSPSGYELRKNYAGADLVSYLPLDTRRNAHRFVSLIDPKLAIIIKYEHWHHHLNALKNKGVPALLVSSIFRPDQPFFRPWGAFWRRMLTCYDLLYVQDQHSVELLGTIGMSERVRQAGDTRFDRVCTVADTSGEIEAIRDMQFTSPVMVAGSTWPEDERLLAAYIHRHPEIRLIIAPHEISSSRLATIEHQFPKVIRWSATQSTDHPSAYLSQSDWQTLLIDNIGMLSRLYRYGQVAYVGGGFHRAGIHNILEAAVYGIPVLFGPNHRKAKEAGDLIKRGGAFSINDSSALEDRLNDLFANPEKREMSGQESGSFVRSQSGATQRVMESVQAYLRSSR
jgi:3-deoxy-D-manno-octulosonic-acid transferase